MTDRFCREINYLRISLTDRCNFRCVYCMPEEGAPFMPKEHLLSSLQVQRLIRIAHDIGITKFRFTGGEPLLRLDLAEMIEFTASLPKVIDISLTTNGQLLAQQAEILMKAGLKRINVSLDTLNPEKFREIARGGKLEAVLEGIERAKEVGMNPIKLNCVLLKGQNDNEINDFVEITRNQAINIRFIELMPIQWNTDSDKSDVNWGWHGEKGLLQVISRVQDRAINGSKLDPMFFSVADAKAKIEAEFGALIPFKVQTNGPAQNFKIEGFLGTVGFISQVTHDFCALCNRIRLTADGFLRPCLMSDGELDLKTPMENGASDEDLRMLFEHVIYHKPERHYLAEGQAPKSRFMSQIGG